MRSLLIPLLLLAACQSPPESLPESLPESPRFLGNTACPISGRPIDPAAYFEHEGERVWFCNPDCAEKSASEPEVWIARAYPEARPFGNTTCVVSGERLPLDAPTVTWQGHELGLCCGTCVDVFRSDPALFVADLD